MTHSTFLAGATGAVGRRLCRLLIDAGHHVTGSTRTPDKFQLLRDLGVEPVAVDVFDAEALRRAVSAAHPDVVIHQLTDLPPGLDSALMPDWRARNARIRTEGTCNLVSAAVVAGATRMIAQSLAFVYAPGPLPHAEEAELDTDAPDPTGASARAVESLEEQVLEAPLDGVILRYGYFYGPGTGFDAPGPDCPLHVDDAAQAAFLAVTRGSGIYNIVDGDSTVSSAKAARDLGWEPGFRLES